jgi:hypothetical protein
VVFQKIFFQKTSERKRRVSPVESRLDFSMLALPDTGRQQSVGHEFLSIHKAALDGPDHKMSVLYNTFFLFNPNLTLIL